VAQIKKNFVAGNVGFYCTKWKISGGKGDFGLSLFSILRVSSLEAEI